MCTHVCAIAVLTNRGADSGDRGGTRDLTADDVGTIFVDVDAFAVHLFRVAGGVGSEGSLVRGRGVEVHADVRGVGGLRTCLGNARYEPTGGDPEGNHEGRYDEVTRASHFTNPAARL